MSRKHPWVYSMWIIWPDTFFVKQVTSRPLLLRISVIITADSAHLLISGSPLVLGSQEMGLHPPSVQINTLEGSDSLLEIRSRHWTHLSCWHWGRHDHFTWIPFFFICPSWLFCTCTWITHPSCSEWLFHLDVWTCSTQALPWITFLYCSPFSGRCQLPSPQRRFCVYSSVSCGCCWWSSTLACSGIFSPLPTLFSSVNVFVNGEYSNPFLSLIKEFPQIMDSNFSSSTLAHGISHYMPTQGWPAWSCPCCLSSDMLCC